VAGSRYDVVIVGAGILGLAAAREILARRPGTRVAVLEKEAAIASHQTGRNSGVIHRDLLRAGVAESSPVRRRIPGDVRVL
jgi:L-2-hydroxyglutarate oxidase LhgO